MLVYVCICTLPLWGCRMEQYACEWSHLAVCWQPDWRWYLQWVFDGGLVRCMSLAHLCGMYSGTITTNALDVAVTGNVWLIFL